MLELGWSDPPSFISSSLSDSSSSNESYKGFTLFIFLALSLSFISLFEQILFEEFLFFLFTLISVKSNLSFSIFSIIDLSNELLIISLLYLTLLIF